MLLTHEATPPATNTQIKTELSNSHTHTHQFVRAFIRLATSAIQHKQSRLKITSFQSKIFLNENKTTKCLVMYRKVSITFSRIYNFNRHQPMNENLNI